MGLDVSAASEILQISSAVNQTFLSIIFACVFVHQICKVWQLFIVDVVYGICGSS